MLMKQPEVYSITKGGKDDTTEAGWLIRPDGIKLFCSYAAEYSADCSNPQQSDVLRVCALRLCPLCTAQARLSALPGVLAAATQ